MGRRPNPLIQEHFKRGNKLADNSNRYPHTCKSCGEEFPKGRADSLINHLVKKCPAIAGNQRRQICLTLYGLDSPPDPAPKAAAPRPQQLQEQPADPSMSQPQNWTALQTLAEVSRHFSDKPNGSNAQVDGDQAVNPAIAYAETAAAMVNATGADQASPSHATTRPLTEEEAMLAVLSSAPAVEPVAAYQNDRFDLSEQFLVDNPAGFDEHDQREKQAGHSPADVKQMPAEEQMTAEEQMKLLQAMSNTTTDADNLNMAAAATARVNQAMVDPQLLGEEAVQRASVDPAVGPPNEPRPSVASDGPEPMDTDPVLSLPQVSTPDGSSLRDHGLTPQPPSMASMTSSWKSPGFNRSPQTPHQLSGSSSMQAMQARGGMRLESSLNGARTRHSRAKFDASRRKEVQEVRKIGACIRCRVLRKMCSKSDPCDTCRKVLAPRVWKTGCIRTKLHECLNIYSAGAQAVHSQNNVNKIRSEYSLKANGASITATHFGDSEIMMSIQVLDSVKQHTEAADEEVKGSTETQTVMLEHDHEDIQGKMEQYVQTLLPTYIAAEPSHFARVTLETAYERAQDASDDCLKRALELWGYVEVMDRERSWTITEIRSGQEPQRIVPGHGKGAYDTMSLQLSASAERKANATCKALLHTMQRLLQDSKVRIEFSMYLACVILLHCVEKTTWAFMAWGQGDLRETWPLSRDPSEFTSQGHSLATNLAMLLGIRRAMPRTARQETSGLLVTEEQDPVIQRYFENLKLNVDEVESRVQKPAFSQAESRSLELVFSSVLLLPNKEDSIS